MKFEVLRKSFQLLDPYSNKFSALFYRNLISNPEVKVFLIKNGIELKERDLAIALIVVIDHIEDRHQLKKTIDERIKNRHIYELVSHFRQYIEVTFLSTLEFCLKDQWTKETKKVWTHFFYLITDLILESNQEKSHTSHNSFNSIKSTVKDLKLKAIAQRNSQVQDSNNPVRVNALTKT